MQNLIRLVLPYSYVLLFFACCLQASTHAQPVSKPPQRNFAEAFPELSKAIEANDQSGLRNAFTRLSVQDRQRVLTALHSSRLYPNTPDNNIAPSSRENDPIQPRGGASLANFSELMQLIETTVSPETACGSALAASEIAFPATTYSRREWWPPRCINVIAPHPTPM